MVTRTVTMIHRLLKVYNTETDGIESISLVSKANDKTWQKKVSAPYKLLSCLEEKPETYLLKMDDETFFRLAESKVIEKNENKN